MPIDNIQKIELNFFEIPSQEKAMKALDKMFGIDNSVDTIDTPIIIVNRLIHKMINPGVCASLVQIRVLQKEQDRQLKK